MQRDSGLPLILLKCIKDHSPELYPVYTELLHGEVIPARKKLLQVAPINSLACYLLALSYLKQSPQDTELAQLFFHEALLAMEVVYEPLLYLSLTEIHAIDHSYLNKLIARFERLGELLKSAFEEKNDLPSEWLLNRALDYLTINVDRQLASEQFVLRLIEQGSAAQLHRAASLPAFLRTLTPEELLQFAMRYTQLPAIDAILTLMLNPVALQVLVRSGVLLKFKSQRIVSALLYIHQQKDILIHTNQLAVLTHSLLQFKAHDQAYALIDEKFVKILQACTDSESITIAPGKLPLFLQQLRSDLNFVAAVVELIEERREDLLPLFHAHLHTFMHAEPATSWYFHPESPYFSQFSHYKKVFFHSRQDVLRSWLQDTPLLPINNPLMFLTETIFTQKTVYGLPQYEPNKSRSAISFFQGLTELLKQAPHDFSLHFLKKSLVSDFAQSFHFAGLSSESAYFNFFLQLFLPAWRRPHFFAHILLQDQDWCEQLDSPLLAAMKRLAQHEQTLLTANQLPASLQEPQRRMLLAEMAKEIKVPITTELLVVPKELSQFEELLAVPGSQFNSIYFAGHNEAIAYLNLEQPIVLSQLHALMLPSERPDKQAFDAYLLICHAIGKGNCLIQREVEPMRCTNRDPITALQQVTNELTEIDPKLPLAERKLQLLSYLALYVPALDVKGLASLKAKLMSSKFSFIDEHESYLSLFFSTATRATVNKMLETRALQLSRFGDKDCPLQPCSYQQSP